ncbi:3-oxoacyl-[acyl-carrier protein] reductase [Pseudonocardia sp. Ae168_Ps1]|uniref:SDR family NAD(P)-dependent oxidoreductase n=1 Tax=unclassified Pseudonocardia TaxID=2619320 RepID=UPI00094AB75B|nr:MULTISPECIES: SDR family oxidoreductase [unclassified Pseudonocardia]OLL73702.1 3-oxoacyl-[acyl-carrier protein] reductase [Pseudonocardia sp. Ae150A_Ps1]OLL79680.1 3-oxoacyl-[acyl-carrier protein] reductase [Pseudonocardia sp. Ae168_Ps1]OLL86184.1 3-oxoacyl-[acyl-carrier protein] reductase [Pseudonocardia sp. Ae263_Ps1]OLL93785.1 3-oxoacyl-[acyl-carrier protein] reductase [Pseudonocardia sp. Ae356_Ps1]
MTVPTPAAVFDLTGRTALVTGASSGLGARFAQVLAAAGATVWAAARREERLVELASRNPLVRPAAADVSSEADRAALMERIVDETGPLDVLVNNAGVGSGARPLDETPDAFAGVLGTNLVGPFHLSQLAARAADGRELSIVNVSSIVGVVATAPRGGAGYAAGKAGLVGLTRQLAGHWGTRGVRVNALAPGWFRTEMNDAMFDDAASLRWIERNTMVWRPGRPPELDGALLFLASGASAYCTGQVLAIDGGWTAR